MTTSLPPVVHTLAAGPRTDLQILALQGSTIEHRGDHLVIRSPQNPDFHWGNYLHITSGDVDDAARWISLFDKAFPHAAHRAFGLPALPARDAWAAYGMEVSTDDVLATRRLPEQRPLPAGYAVRQLTTSAGWEAQVAAELADNARSGEFDQHEHERFVRAQMASRRALSESGRAAFFGAFAGGGELAADLGIVDLGGTARYQSVGTREAFRQQGLAGHLLGVAARWAHERGAREWVIVTGSTNPAGRLYRSVGFDLDVQIVAAYRKPPIAPGPSA
ncbi:GNAT family N-acetyltransferase [Rudaeicoccus suwonensis]|uniref:Ribosomal protein S18 acetylase RimI-like enzyme n=1 Tax=Rudaeicoccus suwonensis TaxID=657409 RepID=A0A561E744_9MICO|nr:GNAT family N-acetyltransferase [Rudaeicoccus suwonensis]TWE11433.1 ribosomal protein S18 acetylase RimI-like enzyme [Rudaeicoccus suwonensis]